MGEARDSGAVMRSGSLVAAGMMAMNVMVYAFTLISSHSLPRADFGGLGAILAVLIVVSVGALALQATGARTIATAPTDRRLATALDILASTRLLAVALGAILLAATPILRSLLHVPWLAAVMVPAAVVPLTLLGGYAGVLQGLRSWPGLTGVFLGLGAGRLFCGGLAIWIDRSLEAAVVGLTVGAYLPAVIGWLGCRRLLSPGQRSAANSGTRMLAEIWHNGHTLLAFFALTNLDVLLARNLLSDDASGSYAAGAILTKSCLFLPQFVIIIAFPDMAEDQARDDRSRAWLAPLGLVAAIGASVTLGTVVLRDLAVSFVGGAKYSELTGYLWLFAVQGTAFALLQMVVYRQIARRAVVAPYLWIGSAGLIALAWLLTRITENVDQRMLVLSVIAVSALAAVPVFRARSGSNADAPAEVSS
ncbi:MAG: lipopolysaccharide biosynthesis protein [Nocardioides sp.]